MQRSARNGEGRTSSRGPGRRCAPFFSWRIQSRQATAGEGPAENQENRQEKKKNLVVALTFLLLCECVTPSDAPTYICVCVYVCLCLCTCVFRHPVSSGRQFTPFGIYNYISIFIRGRISRCHSLNTGGGRLPPDFILFFLSVFLVFRPSPAVAS